jgi:hypothetical protein
MNLKVLNGVVASIFLTSSIAVAANASDLEKALKEVRAIKQSYEQRIQLLEKQINLLSQTKSQSDERSTPASPHFITKSNAFNPSVSAILNGTATSFSRAASEIEGFGVGEEGERGSEGLSLGETELNFSANIDDKFYGSSTTAIVREDGEDKVELEEAYFETLPGAGLPDGFQIKAGRAFWTLGYLNEHHAHSDDFADRPLTHRIFLNKSFNDDGAEASYVLPTNFYSEIGGGIFRGDDFPFGGSVSGLGGYSVFARVGNDVGDNQSWRIGAYTTQGDVNARSTNETAITFAGESDLYVFDLRYTWAPTGNASNQEVIVQAEYFHREEVGIYNTGGGLVQFNNETAGWYAQAVYKFAPTWRIGARYSDTRTADVPAALVGTALDSKGHDPHAIAFMVDWTNSEFGRIRAQYNREELASGRIDNQGILQYVMSIGAHGAHPY